MRRGDQEGTKPYHACTHSLSACLSLQHLSLGKSKEARQGRAPGLLLLWRWVDNIMPGFCWALSNFPNILQTVRLLLDGAWWEAKEEEEDSLALSECPQSQGCLGQ